MTNEERDQRLAQIHAQAYYHLVDYFLAAAEAVANGRRYGTAEVWADYFWDVLER